MLQRIKNSWLRLLQILHITLFLSYAGAIFYYSWYYLDQFNKAKPTIPSYDKSYLTNYITGELEDRDGIGDDINKTNLFLIQNGYKTFDFERGIAEGHKPKDMLEFLIKELAKDIDFNALQKKIDNISVSPSVGQCDFSAGCVSLRMDDNEATEYLGKVAEAVGDKYDAAINKYGNDGSFVRVFIKPKGAPELFWYTIYPKVPFFAKVKLVVNIAFILVVWYLFAVSIFAFVSSVLIYIFKGKIVLNPYYAFQKPKEPTP